MSGDRSGGTIGANDFNIRALTMKNNDAEDRRLDRPMVAAGGTSPDVSWSHSARSMINISATSCSIFRKAVERARHVHSADQRRATNRNSTYDNVKIFAECVQRQSRVII